MDKGKGLAVDGGNKIDVELENWLHSWVAKMEKSEMNNIVRVDEKILNPDSPIMPITNVGANFAEGLSNVSHYGVANEILESSSVTPIGRDTTHNSGNNQLPRVNLNVDQIQIPLIVTGEQQVNNVQPDLLAPVGFATPSEFSSSAAFREYALRQIPKIKDRYFKELVQLYSIVTQLRSKATTMDALVRYQNIKSFMERMMRFLNISTLDSLPVNDQVVYNDMNLIVNYMNRNKKVDQSPSKGINLEANMVNFNQNFLLRTPHVPQQTIMPSSLNNRYFQAQQPTVLVTNQQINSGPKHTSVVGSLSPIGLISNTSVTRYQSYPPNDQPPVSNQKLNSEISEQPIHKKNTHPKRPRGRAPRCANLDVNKVLSPESSKARSPVFLSSTSSTRSGISSSANVVGQKLTTPLVCQGPQQSKDVVHHLVEVVKSVSSKSLSCSSNDISSMEKVADIIPHCIPTNLVHERLRRELSVTSVYNNQIDSQEWDVCSSDTSVNKKPKFDGKWILFEEIEEINAKLLQTTIDVVFNPTEDYMNLILGGHDGTILKCIFRNICVPNVLTSEKMPEFGVLFLVPFDYPAASITVYNWGQNAFSGPWGKLYEEMLTRFYDLNRGVRGTPCQLEDLARKWDASADTVMNKFLHKLGGESFSSRYGSWEIASIIPS